MEASSVRKIYVDSGRKTPSSNSSSDFEFELNRAITLPRKCVAFVTDIHLPHSWYNVDSQAQHLYINEAFDETHEGGGLAQIVRRVTLSPGHRTGTSLASDLQAGLQDLTAMPDHTWTCTYSSQTGTLEIACTHNLGLTHMVSLAGATPSIWQIYNDNTLIREVALTRIGSLTYAYNEAGFDKVLHVSGINPQTRTFLVKSFVGPVLEHVFHWNDTLKRLQREGDLWNWRPKVSGLGAHQVNFTPLQNYFQIYTDHQLATPSIQALFSARGIGYSANSPASINHLLRHEGHGEARQYDKGTTQQTAPDLAGSWQRSVHPAGTVTHNVTWSKEDGANYSYEDPTHGTIIVKRESFDNLLETMIVEIDGDSYSWNLAGYLERGNVRWTRTDGDQSFAPTIWTACTARSALVSST